MIQIRFQHNYLTYYYNTTKNIVLQQKLYTPQGAFNC